MAKVSWACVIAMPPQALHHVTSIKYSVLYKKPPNISVSLSLSFVKPQTDKAFF